MDQGRFKDVDTYMTAVQGATNWAAALTQRPLAFSRRQTLAPEGTDVNILVDGMLDLIRRTVGPSAQVRQMADAARVSRPGLKVLFITGFAENALLASGDLDPGMSVPTKPFAVDALAARIRAADRGLSRPPRPVRSCAPSSP